MKKEDIIPLIQKEWEDNPHAISLEISKKHKIPFTIVEMLRRRIEKRGSNME